ncbi:enoyl-CoA hydratase/isomerase family protein [Mucilaginibacter myungsuensis]|uniref:Enoyl-CoA hydratase/isomerase family protein n=1 Tax=Mucilaginibacter myungsuensis TaxID=649104 RepID=A0A929PW62_9SPHI|nr:enoyl-CoA hydratase/isomerase family protein [Mucilaginibacter myungsuensis]MBE9661746.1 enoyl-CoA hydratase/isomerase family protein [Mucilaginibacter myungsuensis]MDN3599822.1 enoyl-CoA hydratase/isomerase family protein [Mucilaginibacter myungsuensis]
METPDNGYVRSETADLITTISFYHPAQNSLPSVLLTELAQAIEAAGRNEQTRVIILKSAGDRTFCAGASFTELVQINDKQTGAAFFSGFANVINACRTCGKLIIVRVQGKAVGGGVGLAAAADYCLATESAAIKLSELSIGIGPFVIEPAVSRKIGLSAFSSLTINATEFQTAAWAKQYGLYNDVFADAAGLDHAVNSLATKLATYNPDALAAIKSVLWEGTENWGELLTQRAAISGDLVLSQFTQDALQRFLYAPK